MLVVPRLLQFFGGLLCTLEEHFVYAYRFNNFFNIWLNLHRRLSFVWESTAIAVFVIFNCIYGKFCYDAVSS